MPMQSDYIRNSFELNLFFLRIMKEHALFMQLGFTPKNKALADEAQALRQRFNELMRQIIRTAKGYVSNAAIASGELFTRFTEEAERQTQYFTGVSLDLQLTREEYDVGGGMAPPASMKPAADELNNKALVLTTELLQFKQTVLEEVLSCRVFTTNYPLQLDHIVREAQRYIQMLEDLMASDTQLTQRGMADEQAFWNNIMKEHAEFLDGLLDPSEDELKEEAAAFADVFAELEQQARLAKRRLQLLPAVTARSMDAVQSISDFQARGAEGILSCSVRSIIVPLLSDHVLREANFYQRMLMPADM